LTRAVTENNYFQIENKEQYSVNVCVLHIYAWKFGLARGWKEKDNRQSTYHINTSTGCVAERASPPHMLLLHLCPEFIEFIADKNSIKDQTWLFYNETQCYITFQQIRLYMCLLNYIRACPAWISFGNETQRTLKFPKKHITCLCSIHFCMS
jgi:hypothetical protein